MKTTPTNQWSCSQNEEYWDNYLFAIVNGEVSE